MGLIWSQLYTLCLTKPPATKCNIARQETLQQKNTQLNIYPENVYLAHEHDKQRRKPTRTPRPRPRPRPHTKKSKFVNEVMPFLTSRPSSPRFRMESTKGKVDMHFENIAIEVAYVGHDLFHPTTKETNPGLQAPPRYSQREHTVL